MNDPFVEEYRARWVDMDFNQHMRNAAFLGCAEETRMRFLDANGWTMAEFVRRQLGPVVVEDRLVYKKELKLLEAFRVDLAVAAASADGRKMKLRSNFVRASDGALCAVVESFVLWFDLAARKPIAPPEELHAIWSKLARTPDFAPVP